MRIVCVSDTHGFHHKTHVPDGDILIHAGDITRRGEVESVISLNDWLGTLPHPHKVVIAGNHDFCFQNSPEEARALITNASYLEDTSIEINGLRIYGSPWQPWFGGWAFNVERGPEIAAVWAKIPHGTDILITHGPPEGVLDRTFRGEICGCRDLLERIMEIGPKLHVFGHIHEAAGRLDRDGITFVNASTHLGKGSGVVVEWNESGPISSGLSQ